MDLLLDNPLATMEGINFLILYAFVTVSTVLTLGFLKTRLDQSDRLAIPAIPPAIDPFEVAYLRGGPNEVARTAVFALRQKGLIVIANGEKKAYLRPVGGGDGGAVAELELRTLEWIGAEREVREVFYGSSPLVDALERWNHIYQEKLERQALLTPEDAWQEVRRWKWTATAVIAGLGGYKIFAAVLTGHWNVIFTILLMTAGLIATFIVGRTRRRTKLGNAYLDRLQAVFEPVKVTAVSQPRGLAAEAMPVGGFASVDPMLVAAGVFGTATIATSVYPDYD